MGTVIDEAAAKSFERQVNDAVARGAKLLYGNVRRGALYSPTRARPRHARHAGRQVRDLRPGVAGDPLPRHRRGDPHRELDRLRAVVGGVHQSPRLHHAASSSELNVGTVNVREVPGYRLELTPFGGIKDSGLGYKEGVQEAMKSFTNIKTYSLPW